MRQYPLLFDIVKTNLNNHQVTSKHAKVYNTILLDLTVYVECLFLITHLGRKPCHLIRCELSIIFVIISFTLANGTLRKHLMLSKTSASHKIFPREFWRIILVEVVSYHRHPYLILLSRVPTYGGSSHYYQKFFIPIYSWRKQFFKMCFIGIFLLKVWRRIDRKIAINTTSK